MKKIILFPLSILAISCAKSSLPENERAYLEKEDAITTLSRSAPLESPLLNSEWTACQALETLKATKTTTGKLFSLVSHIDYQENQTPQLVGAIDLVKFPLAQLVIPQKFNITPEEFYRSAEQEYLAGNLSALKWKALSASWKASLAVIPFTAQPIPFADTVFAKLQTSALNAKAEEVFPGIFGNTQSMDKSLIRLLLAKISIKEELKSASKILSTSTPLFLSRNWSQYSEDVKSSLKAAIRSSSMRGTDAQSQKERMCALVLWQRSFAQLLSIKGYEGVKLLPSSNAGMGPTSAATKLSAKAPTFETRKVPGVFINSASNLATVLEEKDITDYAPTESKMLSLSSNKNLKETLEMLEAMVYFYQATSPSAPWVKNDIDYVLGDMTNTKTAAIVPAEAHKLACGFISILLKNISEFHFKKINSNGQLLKLGETPAGLVLTEFQSNQKANIDVIDLLRLTRSVIYLDQTLSFHAVKTQANLEKLSDLYGKKKLALLVGKKIFSQEELQTLLTPEEQKGVLLDKLTELRFPLARLLNTMRDSQTDGCVKLLNWDLNTGKSQTSGTCDAETKKEFQETINLFSQYTNSTILQSK